MRLTGRHHRPRSDRCAARPPWFPRSAGRQWPHHPGQRRRRPSRRRQILGQRRIRPMSITTGPTASCWAPSARRRLHSDAQGVESFASNNPPKGTPGPNRPIRNRAARTIRFSRVSPSGRPRASLYPAPERADPGRRQWRRQPDPLQHPPARLSTSPTRQRRSSPANMSSSCRASRIRRKARRWSQPESELLALNDKQFLLIARDSGRGFATPEPASVYRSVDLISIAGATNIAGTDLDGAKPVAPKASSILGDARRICPFHRHQRQCPAQPLRPRTTASRRTPATSTRMESLALLPVGDGAAPDDYSLLVGSTNQSSPSTGSMQASPMPMPRQGCRYGGAGLSRHFAGYVPPVKTQ